MKIGCEKYDKTRKRKTNEFTGVIGKKNKREQEKIKRRGKKR